MAKKLESFYQRQKHLIWGFLFPFIVLEVMAVVMKVQPFGNNSLMLVDGLHQYTPFFADYQEKLKGMDSMLYSFHGGLGYNFLGLWAYYLASPLNLLIAFFPKSMLSMVLSHLILIKIALCGLTATYYFSKRHQRTDLSVVAFGLCYAFSTYIIGYSWNIMWLEVMMMLPLILTGMDRLIKEGDGRMYCITLFYSLFCNFYMSFMSCLFLVLWYLAYQHKDIRSFFKNGLRFAGWSLLAGGLSAVTLLPTYLGIMKTSSAVWDFPKQLWFGSFGNIFYRHFIGTAPFTNSVNDGDINLFCGLLTLVLVAYYFITPKITVVDKIKKAIFILILFFSFNMPVLGYVWHGFHNQYGIPNRFSFVYIMLLLSMAYDAYVIFIEEEHQRLWMFFGAFGILFLAIGAVSLSYSGTMDNKVLGMTIGIIAAYLLFVFLYDRKIIKQNILRYLFTFGLTLEMTSMAVYGLNQNGQVSTKDFFSDTAAIEKIKEKYGNSITSKMELAKGLMLDESIWHTLNCVTMFGSTATGKVVDMMDQLGFYIGINEYLYEGATPLTNNLFSVQTDIFRPSDTAATQFQESGTVDGLRVYTNPYRTSIGYVVSSDIKKWQYTDVNPFEVQNQLVNSAFQCNSIFQMLETAKPQVTDCKITSDNGGGEYVFEKGKTNDNNMVFNIKLDQARQLYLHLDGSEAENTVIEKNGQNYMMGRLNSQILYIGDMKKGDVVTLRIKLAEEGSPTGVMRLTAASFDQAAFNSVYQTMENGMVNISEAKSGYIKGTAALAQNGSILFSIPYDKGWSAKLDGKEVEVNPIGEAFISLDAPEGAHTIELSYCPEGLKTGAAITVVSILIFAGVMINKRKKKTGRQRRH